MATGNLSNTTNDCAWRLQRRLRGHFGRRRYRVHFGQGRQLFAGGAGGLSASKHSQNPDIQADHFTLKSAEIQCRGNYRSGLTAMTTTAPESEAPVGRAGTNGRRRSLFARIRTGAITLARLPQRVCSHSLRIVLSSCSSLRTAWIQLAVAGGCLVYFHNR